MAITNKQFMAFGDLPVGTEFWFGRKDYGEEVKRGPYIKTAHRKYSSLDGEDTCETAFLDLEVYCDGSVVGLHSCQNEREETGMDYRVAQYNAVGKWCGSALAKSDQQAREYAMGMLLLGGKVTVGRWDEVAKEFYDYAELRADGIDGSEWFSV